MPALCDDFSHILMSLTESKDLDEVAVFKATIDSIDSTNNQADITYTTTPLVPGGYPDLISSAVPFFYHCEFSNGSLEDLEKGYQAFAEDDEVYVLHFWGDSVLETGNTYIVGHADIEDIKKCSHDILRITLFRKNSSTYNPSVNDYYVTIFDMSTLEVIPDITFPTVGDATFYSWFSANMEVVTNEGITQNDFVRYQTDFSTEVYTNERVGAEAENTDSCTDTYSNNMYCVWEPTGETGTINEYGLAFYEKHKTCTGYFYSEMVPDTEDGRVVWTGNVTEPPSLGLSINFWNNQTCDDVSPYLPLWGGDNTQTQQYDGDNMYYTFHTFCREGDYEHVFKTPSTYQFFAVHKNSVYYTQEYTEKTHYDLDIDGDFDTCQGLVMVNSFTSMTTDMAYTSEFKIWLPWKPDDEEPFYHTIIAPQYLGNTMNQGLASTGIPSAYQERYRDSENVHTLKIWGDFCQFYYSRTDPYDDNYETQVPLIINDSAMTSGNGGTYGITCCFTFKDAIYEEWISPSGENWPYDGDEFPTECVVDNCSYSYDTYEMAIECAVNKNVQVVDPDTLVTTMTLADFNRTSSAIALEGGVADLVNLFRTTEYPSGDLTRQECYDSRGTYWGMLVELCRYKT